MPKITIAILTYNRKEYLEKCIKSILNQTFQDFLIYIFDNASNYDIERSLKKFNDKRIILIKSEKNLGEQRNYERIFNYKFSSEYLIVFHDDDVMHPLLIEKEIHLLDKHPNMVFVGTGLKFVKDHKKIFSFERIKPIKYPLSIGIKNEENIYICQKPDNLIRLLLNDFDLCYDSVMYRTSFISIIVEKTKMFYYNKFFKWSDRPYLIELTKKGSAGIIKEKLVNYRIHPKQDSQAEAVDRASYLFNLFLFYKENLPQPLSKKDKKLFYSFATNNLILSGFSFSKDWQEYKKFLKQAKNKDIFKLRYLNLRGIYYFFKGAKKLYLQKNG